MEKNFISKHGFVLPNSWQEQSENGVLFSVVNRFLRFRSKSDPKVSSTDLNKKIERLRATNGGEYRTLPNDDNPRFSLDNAMAVAAYSRIFIDSPLCRKNLDKLKMFAPYSKRIDTFCFLLLCKYPIANLLIIPRLVVVLSMLYTAIQPIEEHKIYIKGVKLKWGGTNGKQLAYLRYEGLKMHITWWICTLLFDPVEMFQEYYPEFEHISNQEARKIWGAS